MFDNWDNGRRKDARSNVSLVDERGEKDVPAGLLDCFRAGERWAFDAVYRRYLTLVSRVIGAALRRSDGGRVGRQEKRGWYDPGDLPDLVQEVFARVFSPAARRRFEGHDLKPYLMGIATYVVMEFGRAREKYVLTDIDWIARVTTGDAAVEGDRAGDGVGRLATDAFVASYVAGLAPDLRAVHDLLYVRGLSQRAAAEALAVGRQTVRTLDSKLRSSLRRLLETERQREGIITGPLRDEGKPFRPEAGPVATERRRRAPALRQVGRQSAGGA